MSRFAKLFAANAIAAAGLGSVAVALSSTAAADPVMPPVVPGVPAMAMIQEFATNPAAMGAVLQTAATALNGASAMVGAPAPNTLPVSPIVGAPATPPVPAPAAAPMGIGSTVVPLLTQIGIPAQLVNLAPQLPALGTGITPAATPLAPAAAPIAPAVAVAPVAPVAPAVAVAPVAPVVPGSTGLNPLPLLTALP
jgi:hypothetical protein